MRWYCDSGGGIRAAQTFVAVSAGEHAGQYEKYREAWELLGAAVKVE